MIRRDWWRWPEDKARGIVPWWTILWRLPFAPVYYVGLTLCWLSIVATLGWAEARRFWNGNA